MHLMDYLAQPRPDMDTQRYDPTKRKVCLILGPLLQPL